MDFEHTAKTKGLVEALVRFRAEEILPNEHLFEAQVDSPPGRWKPVPLLEDLRAKAKAAGLWNLFMRGVGHDLSNVEYAPLAEVMGWNEWMPEVFNCHPPDTGNMEVLRTCGTEEQKAAWLQPLLEGEIRSCFAMTEPDVASSDATNIATRAEAVGDEWVINGRKWWISGPGNPLCKLAIVMCLSHPEAERHGRHSAILVPLDAPGLTIKRQLTVFGIDHAPRGQSELVFENVRVPIENTLLGPGRGFEVAQARLGSGRLHHAMRCVGAAERGLELMCRRGLTRKAFGKPIIRLGGNEAEVARSRMEIDMVRLLTLRAAWLADARGLSAARSEISQAKVAAASMACGVIDRAIQLHGAAGLSQDTPLAALYARLRTMRIVDGPDEVHLRTIAKNELAGYAEELSHSG